MSGNTPPGGSDPSMDDILASIRKILNDDEQGTVAMAPRAEATETIELTPDMMIAPPETVAAPAPQPAVMAPTNIMPPRAPATPPPPPAPEPAPMSLEQPLPPAGLIDPTAAAAAVAALGQLTRAVAQERSASITRNGPSIEDVVREELRPLLKAWLDEHLPTTVERMVRAEIERVMARQG